MRKPDLYVVCGTMAVSTVASVCYHFGLFHAFQFEDQLPLVSIVGPVIPLTMVAAQLAKYSKWDRNNAAGFAGVATGFFAICCMFKVDSTSISALTFASYLAGSWLLSAFSLWSCWLLSKANAE